MIIFHPLTSIQPSDDIWDQMDNLEAVTVIAMAKVMNEDPKYKLNFVCPVHFTDTHIDIIFTDKMEFVFREVCCEEYKAAINRQLDVIKESLKMFFGDEN